MNEILKNTIDIYNEELEEIIDEFVGNLSYCDDYIPPVDEVIEEYERALKSINELEKKYEAIFEEFPEEECEFDYAYEFASDCRATLYKLKENSYYYF